MLSKALGLFLALVGIFAVLFLGGLASAAWEIRAEKRAGKEVTRPAWDERAKRRALGRRGVFTSHWARLTHRLTTCWCGLGPLIEFEALDDSGSPETVRGIGCSAWEAGLPEAIRLHEEAGGYARVPRIAS